MGEPSDESSFPALYIGEGDPILERLKSHNANKDFWTSAIAFTSKDTSLNKAHVQHLESRLIDIARQNKLCKLENTVMPTQPSLSEWDCADVEQFLETLLSILPLLGLSAFKSAQTLPQAAEDTLMLHIKGITAHAVQTSSGFVVLKGSEASATHTTAYRPRSSKPGKICLPAACCYFRMEKRCLPKMYLLFAFQRCVHCCWAPCKRTTRMEKRSRVSLKDLQAEDAS